MSVVCKWIPERIPAVCPTGESLLIFRTQSQALESKIFLFFRSANQVIPVAIPSHSEGRCATSTARDGDAVDADGARDESA